MDWRRKKSVTSRDRSILLRLRRSLGRLVVMFKFTKCEKCEKQIVEDDETIYKKVDSNQLALFDKHTGKPWYEMVKLG